MREEELFQLIERLLTGRGPIPTVVLFHKIQKGVGNSRVVRDESTVEVDKAKEGSYIFDFGRGWPGGDAVKFDQVYDKLTRFHDHSKVFYFWDVKLTLLEL